ncbi:hypothetical protein [Allosphingosinicella indica]|uniref:Uncharacterized protein n=1 Tax=Allosphingosinicella indica TaxID=941907 RepID=A0A1X7G1L3_9SPHN|nr:hypothetical protein [Allosphingosinicella indica]SMF61773.1 hypothetical protein SAMN06295910_0766 [Allosphingosinicella indica]
MTRFVKGLTGVAAAAMMTVTAAAPAQAQYYDRYYSRDRGVDAGAIIAGVAVLGGIAAIASAIGNDGNRYGYDARYRYRDDYRSAVNACAWNAERYGRVQVRDIERTGANRYRVRGTVDSGYNRWNHRGDYFTCTARSNGRVTNFRLG